MRHQHPDLASVQQGRERVRRANGAPRRALRCYRWSHPCSVLQRSVHAHRRQDLERPIPQGEAASQDQAPAKASNEEWSVAMTSTLATLVAAVGQELGDYELVTYDTDRVDWCAGLRGPDGAELFFDTAWKRGRLSVRGSARAEEQNVRDLLHGLPHGLPVITVAPDAAPARIAAEIRRRLLPEYLPALTAARQAAARQRRPRRYRHFLGCKKQANRS